MYLSIIIVILLFPIWSGQLIPEQHSVFQLGRSTVDSKTKIGIEFGEGWCSKWIHLHCVLFKSMNTMIWHLVCRLCEFEKFEVFSLFRLLSRIIWKLWNGWLVENPSRKRLTIRTTRILYHKQHNVWSLDTGSSLCSFCIQRNSWVRFFT